MQRKPGFPVANCSIKMPDNTPNSEAPEEEEPHQRRQQLINFGHSQWGFNNWSWAVSRQDLDFVDLVCGKYTAGVAAFVTITVKTFEIHRENVGYATSIAATKGAAIHQARKCAVTNALRETLLSFGGSVGAELLELDAPRLPEPTSEPQPENNPNLANLPGATSLANAPKPSPVEPKNTPLARNAKKEEVRPAQPGQPAQPPQPAPPAVKNALSAPPPVAKALPMPANLPPAANRPPAPPAPRPPAAPPAHPAHPAHPPHAAHPVHPAHPAPRPNSNAAAVPGLPGGDSEEARAERKRRQRLAQEEFRLKQLQRQQGPASSAPPTHEGKQDIDNISTSVDNLLMAIPTQDILKDPGSTEEEPGKRKSPGPDGGAAKRRGNVLSRLDIP